MKNAVLHDTEFVVPCLKTRHERGVRWTKQTTMRQAQGGGGNTKRVVRRERDQAFLPFWDLCKWMGARRTRSWGVFLQPGLSGGIQVSFFSP